MQIIGRNYQKCSLKQWLQGLFHISPVPFCKVDVMAGALVATLEQEVIFQMITSTARGDQKKKGDLAIDDIVELPQTKHGLAPFGSLVRKDKPLCV